MDGQRIRINARKKQELNAEWKKFCMASRVGRDSMVQATVIVGEEVEVLEYIVSDVFCDFLADREFSFWFA